MGQTILVVDDSIDDRFFIARALKRMATGLGVQFVTCGDDAVAYLNGSGMYADRASFPYPAFVITDLDMPRGDGFSVLQHIQALAPALLRVLVLSDSQDPNRVRRAYALGANGFCAKPHDHNALPRIISKLLYPDPLEGRERLMPLHIN